MKLISNVKESVFSEQLKNIYDLTSLEHKDFIRDIIEFPKDFKIGVIYGSSGSGKTQILKNYFNFKDPEISWDQSIPIIDHFITFEDAVKSLNGVGLRSIPDWVKNRSILSNGQGYRADLARSIKSGCGIDEFTSVLDRITALSVASSLMKYIKREGFKNIVISTCHDDIIPELNPDWVFNTNTWAFQEKRFLRQKRIFNMQPIQGKDVWGFFKDNHYLTSNLNKSASCWIVTDEKGNPAAFQSILTFPSGTLKHAYREHRLVVRPEYQGIGLGRSVSEATGQHLTQNGFRFFSKTANPALGEYRNSSKHWRPTSKNGKKRKDYLNTKLKTKEDKHKIFHAHRLTYSHEYIYSINPNIPKGSQLSFLD